MVSGETQTKSNASLSMLEKMMMLRGMFNPHWFKENVRPRMYKKANDDPERVNEMTLQMLKENNFEMSMLSLFFRAPEELRINVNGQRIIPFGTAAGLDKDGNALEPFSHFFGFMEPGTVFVNPRTGNDRPRVHSDDPNMDMYNALGFPSKGIEYFKNNIINYRKHGGKKPVYVNICGMPLDEKNAERVEVHEMKRLLKELGPYADGFVWDPASPNTEVLKFLRDPVVYDENAKLMKELAPGKLLLVKIKPYEEHEKDFELKLVESFINGGGHGVVTTNTKQFPREHIPVKEWGYKSGGRSGKFLRKYRLRSVKEIRAMFPESVIVATGGIFDGDDAYETFKVGADMLEGYTPYAFYGLGLLKEIENGVVRNLHKDGYETLAQMQADVKEGKHVTIGRS